MNIADGAGLKGDRFSYQRRALAGPQSILTVVPPPKPTFAIKESEFIYWRFYTNSPYWIMNPNSIPSSKGIPINTLNLAHFGAESAFTNNKKITVFHRTVFELAFKEKKKGTEIQFTNFQFRTNCDSKSSHH